MQAVIEMTDDEWKTLQTLTRIDEANEAVRTAVREYLRVAAVEALKRSAGTIEIQENWQDLERLELEE